MSSRQHRKRGSSSGGRSLGSGSKDAGAIQFFIKGKLPDPDFRAALLADMREKGERSVRETRGKVGRKSGRLQSAVHYEASNRGEEFSLNLWPLMNVAWWAIIYDVGAQPHVIKPKSGSHLKLYGNRYVTEVDHPGTRGTKVFRNARATAKRRLTVSIRQKMEAEMLDNQKEL